MVLRPARMTDAIEIADMSRHFIEAGLGWSWIPSRVACCIRGRNTVVVVAQINGSVAGFAIMSFAVETAHLQLLAVRPRFRRRGVGRRLLAWLEETALTAGTPLISLELRAGNRAALSFYQRLGYRRTGRVHGYYGKEAAERMGRDLWSMADTDTV